jgi:tetratricopeptide (TPR) repeat protein
VLKAKIGRVYGQFGSARGLPYLQEALAELDPMTQPNHVAEVAAVLGRYQHYAGRHGPAIELLERARAIAEPLDDPDTVSGIYGSLAGAYQHLLRLDDSLGWARRCIAYGEKKSYLPAVIRGHMFVAQNSTWLGQWTEALAAAAHQAELASRTGAEHRAAWAEHDRAVALYYSGDVAGAATAAREALRLAEASGERRVAALVLKTVSQSAGDLGDHVAAREHAEAAIVRADQLGDQVARALARGVLAYLYVQREEWDRAAELGDAYAAIVENTDNRLARVMFGPTLAEAALGSGHGARALALIEAAVALARQNRTPHFEGVARRVQGHVLASQGRQEEALAALDDAVQILERLGSRLELGRALYHRGLGHHQRGRSAVAATDLHQAREIFAAIGARADLARVEHAHEISIG